MLEWARELLDAMRGLCELLDQGEPARPYTSALEQQRAKLDDVERTPSARLLADMRQTGESFFELAGRMSKMHKDYFLGLYPPNEHRLADFAAAGARVARGASADRGERQDGFRHLSCTLFGGLRRTSRREGPTCPELGHYIIATGRASPFARNSAAGH